MPANASLAQILEGLVRTLVLSPSQLHSYHSIAVSNFLAWSLATSVRLCADRFYTGEPVLKFGFGLSELRQSVQAIE